MAHRSDSEMIRYDSQYGALFRREPRDLVGAAGWRYGVGHFRLFADAQAQRSRTSRFARPLRSVPGPASTPRRSSRW